MGNFSKFGRGKTTGLAEQMYHHVQPSDIKHIKNVLGTTDKFGVDMAYKLAKEQPSVAKLIANRKGKTVRKNSK